MIRSAETQRSLTESEQIHHCPRYLTPDRKLHSYAESPIALWGIFIGNIKELGVAGAWGRRFWGAGLLNIHWVPTKLEIMCWGPYGIVLTIPRNRYYCSPFTDAGTKDGKSYDHIQKHTPRKQPHRLVSTCLLPLVTHMLLNAAHRASKRPDPTI